MSDLALAVDVGNSRFKIGLFRPSSTGTLPDHVESLVVPLAEELPWSTIAAWVGDRPPRGIVAGANPAGIRRVVDTWPHPPWTAPLLVDDPTKFPIRIDVPFPGGVGIDRLLNAVAANVLRDDGQPAILVDSGTATTVDYVSATGRFQGGAILPGLELAARSLHHYTALLPEIPVEEIVGRTVEPLGQDTRSALRSGLFHGQLGGVRELVRRFEDRDTTPPLVLLTGGGADSLSGLETDRGTVRLERQLTLQGLVLVAESIDHDD